MFGGNKGVGKGSCTPHLPQIWGWGAGRGGGDGGANNAQVPAADPAAAEEKGDADRAGERQDNMNRKRRGNTHSEENIQGLWFSMIGREVGLWEPECGLDSDEERDQSAIQRLTIVSNDRPGLIMTRCKHCAIVITTEMAEKTNRVNLRKCVKFRRSMLGAWYR
eukprot:766024-Hanusia_phi.AAC.8